jgi:hypothetical protein
MITTCSASASAAALVPKQRWPAIERKSSDALEQVLSQFRDEFQSFGKLSSYAI